MKKSKQIIYRLSLRARVRSACFGQAFLELHPTKYAQELVKKMEKNGAKAYLVNTGWNGTGKRISIRDTRGIIDAILDGSIDKAPTKVIPFFNFVVPTLKRARIANKWWVMNASLKAAKTKDLFLKARAEAEVKWIGKVANETEGNYIVVPWKE